MLLETVILLICGLGCNFMFFGLATLAGCFMSCYTLSTAGALICLSILCFGICSALQNKYDKLYERR